MKFLEPDKAVPYGHEGDPKEETKGASHFSDHGGRVVQELLSLYGCVPGWSVPEPSVPGPVVPGLSNHSKDIVRRLERSWYAASMKLVGQVTTRLATTGQVSDHLQFFICHLKVDSFKFPRNSYVEKYAASPVLVNLSADVSSWVTPNIPAGSTSKLVGEVVLHANRKLVILVLLARILGYIQLNVLGCRHFVE